ncbi:AAA family ATPase [Mycobacteroides franklinii]|uniref:AAA family ATPase n=1 Tax=Mycobacteroides franklinii TaxID=948102 RepID=UPI0013E8BA03
MSHRSGGTAAASGLFYQYLFTIEKFFALLDDSWPGATQIRIEDPDDPDITDPDIVDFSVYHPQDGLCAIYQAKSVVVPDDSTISASEALNTLIRLTASAQCPKYRLVTNARPGNDIAHLNYLLAKGLSDEKLLNELRQLVSGSPTATAALSSLDTPEKVDRLRRAQVRATGECADVIRKRIATAIRSWRSNLRLSLGPRAARILENSLITDIFARAAKTHEGNNPDSGRSYRALTLDEFAAWLTPSAMQTLAQVAGRIEAGEGIEHVPSGEGIDRPAQIRQVLERFSNVRSRNSRLCALVGPSGIGKTRLAAMFAHREREAYDRVCWLDADSDASIIASIVKQRRSLGLEDFDGGGEPDELATAFKEAVSTFIGRWLIVFDNATDARRLQRWITTAGNAQFLVTSTNAVDWTGFSRIEIPRMKSYEALELLRSRLIDDLKEAPTARRARAETAMSELAVQLECRPLALQIAASHFETTSALVDGIDTYTASITEYMARIIDDDTLDLDGYPRTLQAAINICLDRLAAATDHDGQVALSMLAASAVLASRSIPVWLLFAAATEPIDTLIDTDGPSDQLRAQLPALNSALHRIRAQSLMERRDEPAPGLSWELQRRFDINEIVQYVLRRRLEGLAAILDATAAHLGVWIGGYMNRQDFTSATVVQPHALHILSLAEHTDGDVSRCAVLAGNIAIFLNLQGRSSEAISWLQFEHLLLQQLPTPSYRLMAMTATQIIEAMLRAEAPYSDVRSYLTHGIDALEAAAANGDLQWDGGRVCVNLSIAIDVCARRAEHDENSRAELGPLSDRLKQLRTVFPINSLAEQHLLSQSIEGLIECGDYEQALALTQDITGRIDPHNHLLRLQTKNQRLEILAALGRYDQLHNELADFIDDHEHQQQVVIGIAQSLLNTATHVVLGIILTEGNHERSQQILATLIRITSTLCTNDYERYGHVLLAAYECSYAGDLNGVRSLLELADTRKPATLPWTVRDKARTPPHAFIIRTWLDYWLECAQLGTPARVIGGTALSRAYPLPAGGDHTMIGILAPKLDNEIHSATAASRTFGGQWRHGLLGVAHALEIREGKTDRPIACVLLNDGVQHIVAISRTVERLATLEDIDYTSEVTVILKSSTKPNQHAVVELR